MKNIIKEVLLQEAEKKKKADDRCVRIAKRKYDVWPSAYASGAVVKCRQGKIWKNESLEYDIDALTENTEYEDLTTEAKKDFSKEKEKGLHGWFERRGAPGKTKGWVDCNTCRDGKCKSCGRQEGENRSKYPRCRPTPSQCKGYKRPDQR